LICKRKVFTDSIIGIETKWQAKYMRTVYTASNLCIMAFVSATLCIVMFITIGIVMSMQPSQMPVVFLLRAGRPIVVLLTTAQPAHTNVSTEITHRHDRWTCNATSDQQYQLRACRLPRCSGGRTKPCASHPTEGKRTMGEIYLSSRGARSRGITTCKCCNQHIQESSVPTLNLIRS
jgi:hypothetical protein